jgi:hypothetical protein
LAPSSQPRTQPRSQLRNMLSPLLAHLVLLALTVVLQVGGAAAAALRAHVEADCSYYVALRDAALEGAPAAFALGGRFHVLSCNSVKAVRGRHARLGAYSGWEMGVGVAGESADLLVLKVYNLGDASGVLFGYETLRDLDPGLADQGQLAGFFPAFSGASASLDGRLSWHGDFAQAQEEGQGCQEGTQGGPCVLFSSADPSHGPAIMLSALDQFLTTSRAVRLWDGSGAVWAGGTVGSVARLPRGFAHWFVVVGAEDGVTETVSQWGALLRRAHNTTRVPDLTVDALGYQTDNGAQYCFGCGDGCDAVLLRELAHLGEIGVPVRYLSYQNAWWHGSGSAPWCVSDWDWVPRKVPMGVPEFHRRAGLPFQLYAPYFCTDTKYERNFSFVASNPALPSCEGFAFKDVAPEDSLRFYEFFFALGQSYGMTSFETDFVNQNLNCVERFLREVGAAEMFLDGLTTAALRRGIAVQWCFASPSALMQALKYPVVTNARASFDFYYGGSWDIGLSSLLLWALASAPSTDTFWTSDNGQVATTMGGCDKKQGCPEDHSEAGCELHTLLALMSTGPVGFSDAVNHTNATRIRQTCRADGVLVKPNKPLTKLDARMRTPYHALHTYSGPPGAAPGAPGSVWAWYLVAHHLDAAPEDGLEVLGSELWPRPRKASPRAGGWLVRVGTAHAGHACALNGSALPDCAAAPSAAGPDGYDFALRLPRANGTFDSMLLTVVPRCKGGWALLGQTDKYAALGAQRFAAVECTAGGMVVRVRGAPGESGTLAFATPRDTVLVLPFRIPSAKEPWMERQQERSLQQQQQQQREEQNQSWGLDQELVLVVG